MVLQRVVEFLKFKSTSFNRFEIILGVSHGGISNAFKYNKNIRSNVIEKILVEYPELNAEWLLRGHGKMIIEDKEEQVNEITDFKNYSNEQNELLVQQVIDFCDVKSKTELQLLLNQAIGKSGSGALSKLVLETWEVRYGQEFKSLNHQVVTLVETKLRQDFGLDETSTNSSHT